MATKATDRLGAVEETTSAEPSPSVPETSPDVEVRPPVTETITIEAEDGSWTTVAPRLSSDVETTSVATTSDTKTAPDTEITPATPKAEPPSASPPLQPLMGPASGVVKTVHDQPAGPKTDLPVIVRLTMRGPIRLPRLPDATEKLQREIRDTEAAINDLVDQLRPKNPTAPPAEDLGGIDGGPPGVSQTVEECRDSLREIAAHTAKLEGIERRLKAVCAKVAQIPEDAITEIYAAVDALIETLRTPDENWITWFRKYWEPPLFDALAEAKAKIEKTVEQALAQQREQAAGAQKLMRDLANVADAPKSENEKSDSNNAEKNNDKKTGDGKEAGGGTMTGGGGKKHYDQIPAPGKQDSASIDTGSKDEDAEDDEDPNAGVKEKLAEIAERLAEQQEEQPPQGEAKEEPSLLDRIASLAPLAMAGIAAMGPVVGMAGPAMTAAAQREQFERERRDEEAEDDDDQDDASERRNVASANASPSNGETPPPGADPKVANLGDRQVPTGSEAEARALELAYRDQDAELPRDAENSEPMDPAQLKKGETGVAVYENGWQRVFGTDEGPKVVSKDQVAAWDPNKAPPDYGNFLGLRDPNRLDAPPAQVTAAPPPPGQTALV